jgi:hypothetical protein
METDLILMCIIALVLGYLVSRMTRGNGLMVGGQSGGSCPANDPSLNCSVGKKKMCVKSNISSSPVADRLNEQFECNLEHTDVSRSVVDNYITNTPGCSRDDNTRANVLAYLMNNRNVCGAGCDLRCPS